MKLLFVGDSITEMHRDVNANYPSPFSFGAGFVFFVEEMMARKNLNFSIINRGIGGNKIDDIDARFEQDVININSDIVTILVGVNDVWHYINHGGDIMPLAKWEEIYESFLSRIKHANPNAKIILMEPFFLHGTATDENYEFFKKVYKLANSVRKLAKSNNVQFVSLQQKLRNYGLKYGDEHILYDGVHPTVLGSKVIADEWMKSFRNIINENK